MAVTNAQVLAAIVALTQAIAAQAPATARPATAAAKSPTKFGETEFGASVLAKPRVACAITAHGTKCNRTFGAASSGATNHEPRIV